MKRLLPVLLLIVSFPSCALFKGAGNDFVKGAIKRLEKEVDGLKKRVDEKINTVNKSYVSDLRTALKKQYGEKLSKYDRNDDGQYDRSELFEVAKTILKKEGIKFSKTDIPYITDLVLANLMKGKGLKEAVATAGTKYMREKRELSEEQIKKIKEDFLARLEGKEGKKDGKNDGEDGSSSTLYLVMGSLVTAAIREGSEKLKLNLS